MKVLIATYDVFHKVGGGETVYRHLIETNPDIQFFYLLLHEPQNTRRPPNASGIPYKRVYGAPFILDVWDLEPPYWVYGPFIEASDIAASVAGRQFDIVEIPDYNYFGSLLQAALRHHGVGFERVVLAMHGTVSTTRYLDWETEGLVDIPVDVLEQWQYRTADIRYGISQSYLDEWKEISCFEAHYLNPLRFLEPPQPRLAPISDKPSDLNFIGRTEKGKGPDLFVELVARLPRSCFHTANIIGPQVYGRNGKNSNAYLARIADEQGVQIGFLPPMNKDELQRLFASRAVTLLPSRIDRFNLVAQESLWAGCPTAISDSAGICRFLRETLPKVPFVIIEMQALYSCLPEIQFILENYDEYRERLVSALINSKPQITGPTLKEIYHSSPCSDMTLSTQIEQWYNKLIRFHKASNQPVRCQLRAAGAELVQTIAPTVAASANRDARITAQAGISSQLWPSYKHAFLSAESTEDQLVAKLNLYWNVASGVQIDRVRIWREIARLERMRGNDMIAVTYQLRVMRALGEDRFGDLSQVTATLEKLGFSREAETAQAMFGPHTERDQRCAALLERAFVDHRRNPARDDYELVDDRRPSSVYRVSIIVSLYNAAEKLPFFLKALSNQALIKSGTAEVILIDSGSPTNEYSVFQACMSDLDMPIVYVRTAQRETIQSAWNRGVALSRAPYLTFLGVDETIVPDCLEILAAQLDADPTLDWVQGSSVVTEVDSQGTWLRNIMQYDRTGYRQDLVYLETCYLSWVGALYRRSIHDRFGYYDPTFRAAGDTEFKNRVLPFIKSEAVPGILGTYLNYPEGQTTASPLAEIEDLRAWYLHRTVAGIRYAFANRDPGEAEALFCDALRYRKSYFQHWSTDVEYAYNLGIFLQDVKPDSPTSKYLPGVKQVSGDYRTLDWLPNLSPWAATLELARVEKLVLEVEQQQRALGQPTVQPFYRIFNDNRYEQHSMVWRSNPSSFENRRGIRYIWQ